jgi:hypothetical protein
MSRRSPRAWWPALLVLAGLGCGPPPTDDEPRLREVFAAFQRAVAARDADALWDLLSPEARGAADRVAETLRTDYKTAAPEERAKQAEPLGLGPGELARVSGKGYLKTTRFLELYREVPGSTFQDAGIDGDRATINYVEEHGDGGQLPCTRTGGVWKVAAKVE